ncbi:hypothetical protein [Clostridium botulinum]|uniref:hypothetical protein n=1 Tax=Clostridium botulinum TaxID=1491 RepID=UPI0004D81A4E|nr:hypothetical protein [Clostridium botulinum]KEH90507.1 hypothetical protein Z963_p0064 [Clostridium botulinum C/D str. It1]
MKFNREVIKKAHEMAREIKKEYPEVDYKTQFGLCLSYLLSEKEEDKKPTWEDVEKACEEAVYDLNMTDYYVNNWQKGDKDRSYIELRFYRKGRCKTRIACGYWDNVTDEYVPESRYKRQYDVLNKEYV